MCLKSLFSLPLLLSFIFSYGQQADRKIPIGGNAFVSNSKGAKVTDKGIENWQSNKELITLYLRVEKPGSVVFSINQTAALKGKSVVEFSLDGVSKRVVLDEAKKYEGTIGTWHVKAAGYLALTIRGISRTGAGFPNIMALNVGGTAIDEQTSYVKHNEDNYFHWGRRGPSVHLSYTMPESVNAEWFYNEMTVPPGNDVIGSYFMANGFAEGYFGIQVNSRTERRVLFSVWSPFQTDNPNHVPESHKIIMLRKGRDVHTGEFGNEGSGGQSFFRYNWKTGTTYRFLLRAEPSKENYTIFTAYFFAPEQNEWRLIASFKRPQTQTYLKRVHSFLENFNPEYGDRTRVVNFTNQWICDTKGRWAELRQARFTTDNTGAKNYRKDYAGGATANRFYLKNCGFFNEYSPAKTIFTREISNQQPKIDFDSLP